MKFLYIKWGFHEKKNQFEIFRKNNFNFCYYLIIGDFGFLSERVAGKLGVTRFAVSYNV